MADYRIALDAGHGGSDPGAVYKGRQEKDDTLDLTLAVGDILKKNGIDVYYTRTTDEYETPFKKATDANNSGADLFVSIHRNSSENPNQYSGVETLVYSDTGLKAEVARNINNQLEDAGFKNLGVDERKNLVVLKRTKMPAVLVEVGFINNDKDNYLFDEEFDSIQSVDPQRNTIPVNVVKEGGIISGGEVPAWNEAEFATVHKKYRVITRAFADLCNPEAGYEPETAQNSIELKKGEYHDYHIYLNATRYTVEPGHSLALVITTEDPINCLIHKTYSVEIENASVTAEVPMTAVVENRVMTRK